MKTTPPMGRFLQMSVFFTQSFCVLKHYIQKHHLQLTRSVKTPPIRGPILEKSPNILTTIPRNRGRISKVHTYVKIPKAPWRSAPAPIPVTALPAINAPEDGAIAVTRDPTTVDQLMQMKFQKITYLQRAQ
jgi:hypothetical protein